MSLGKKIQVFILLATMLSVSFPIQEFFHNHYFSLNEQHYQLHAPQKYSAHFCFYIYISQHFSKQDEIVFLPIEYLVISTLTKTIKSLYLRLHLNSYFLRGPPLLSSK